MLNCAFVDRRTIRLSNNMNSLIETFNLDKSQLDCTEY